MCEHYKLTCGASCACGVVRQPPTGFVRTLRVRTLPTVGATNGRPSYRLKSNTVRGISYAPAVRDFITTNGGGSNLRPTGSKVETPSNGRGDPSPTETVPAYSANRLVWAYAPKAMRLLFPVSPQNYARAPQNLRRPKTENETRARCARVSSLDSVKKAVSMKFLQTPL